MNEMTDQDSTFLTDEWHVDRSYLPKVTLELSDGLLFVRRRELMATRMSCPLRRPNIVRNQCSLSTSKGVIDGINATDLPDTASKREILCGPKKAV